MALKHSYTLIAPFYDLIAKTPLHEARKQSLARLQAEQGAKILINGIGSGLDIPHLPKGPGYTGTDTTPAMLSRAQRIADRNTVKIDLLCADSHQLPFDNNEFDAVIMHLILAVVPDPARALLETQRVLKPGGRVYIFDKFLKPGQIALFRRIMNIMLRHVATRTDVVFEDALAASSTLRIVHDRPALAGGWFRLIELQKRNQ